MKEGKHLFAAAILDENQNMIGSVMIVDYPSKEALTAQWLDSEPYIVGNVWQEIEIKSCRVPDFFLDKGRTEES